VLRRLSRELLIEPSEIELIIFDVDGVMTDNRITFVGSELEGKAFSVADGFAFKTARYAPIKFAVISARYSDPTITRCTEMGIEDIYQQFNKQTSFDDLLDQHNLKPEQVGHVGNDLPDVLLLEQVGLAICTADCESEVDKYCHYQTGLPGGAGCCREVIEFILAAKGFDLLQLYRDVVANAKTRP
jgi:3-deoxy-D-manno-octulosonate 8-phosphate phosphatase (KDO 8-P phosphatase)